MFGLGRSELRSDIAIEPLVTVREGCLCQDGITASAEPSSFKDRGAEVLMAACMLRGVDRVVADSSGNAGVAVARAAALRRIKAHVVVPEATPTAKLDAMLAHGAEVEVVAGDREAAHQRALELARSTVYASHIFQPFFHAGVASLAWELALVLGDRLPHHLFLPVGNGSLLLGMLLGWRTLIASALAPEPVIHAVQLQGYATLALEGSAGPATNRGSKAPRAAGIAITKPPRMRDIETAMREHHGDVTIVHDDDIRIAEDELEELGMRCDATGAAAYAGWKRHKEGRQIRFLALVTSKR
ncbi:MAG TPA: pyridoxal-phosphate dependent enzyme [Thermoanaerobaculia bacterium]|nr:pyridoxal-phosphate dependent enzyme [Thermoanaerobaculia bacterium]